jgi:hypothetical protein
VQGRWQAATEPAFDLALALAAGSELAERDVVASKRPNSSKPTA